MMQTYEDLLSLGLACTFSQGKGADHAPDLGHKGLAFEQVTDYNIQF